MRVQANITRGNDRQASKSPHAVAVAILLCAGLSCLLSGCGGGGSSDAPASSDARVKDNRSSKRTKAITKKDRPARKDQRESESAAAAPRNTSPADSASTSDLLAEFPPGDDQLTASEPAAAQPNETTELRPQAPPPARTAPAPLSPVDAEAFGLRRIDGKHIILYTDLPPAPAIDELPRVFDLAVPQWCDYFGVPRAEAEKWRVIGSLMKDKQRFLNAALLPAQMPPFLHGFQLGDDLWLYEQPTDYYRRHLLLHEGVHGFMNWRFQGCGPPWYMEGMAELLATHRWVDGKLTLRYSPRSKDEAPYWGRVKIIKEDYAAERGLTLMEVMKYGPSAHLRVEPYGWSWAATNFLDHHPTRQKAFRTMTKHAHDNGPFFGEQMLYVLGRKQMPRIEFEWRAYVGGIEYGYDIERNAIDWIESQPLPASGATVAVKAERGWQLSGYRLSKGKRYRLTASGQFQIARDSEPWISEPQGVTIRYYRRRPIGQLLAAVEDPENPSEEFALLKPLAAGAAFEWTAERDGELFLQLNDFPAERADNAGQVEVRIEQAGE